MADPRDKEFEDAFAQIPDDIPDSDMPPEFPFPDDLAKEQSADDDPLPDGVEEVEIDGRKMQVEEMDSNPPSPSSAGFFGGGGGGGGGSDLVIAELQRLNIAMQRLPDEIAEALKG